MYTARVANLSKKYNELVTGFSDRGPKIPLGTGFIFF